MRTHHTAENNQLQTLQPQSTLEVRDRFRGLGLETLRIGAHVKNRTAEFPLKEAAARRDFIGMRDELLDTRIPGIVQRMMQGGQILPQPDSPGELMVQGAIPLVQIGHHLAAAFTLRPERDGQGAGKRLHREDHIAADDIREPPCVAKIFREPVHPWRRNRLVVEGPAIHRANAVSEVGPDDLNRAVFLQGRGKHRGRAEDRARNIGDQKGHLGRLGCHGRATPSANNVLAKSGTINDKRMFNL